VEPTTSNAKGNSRFTTCREFTLRVKGLPGPKGSRNRNAHGGTYDQSKRAAQWQQDVALQVRSEMIRRGLNAPLQPPYAVTIFFCLPKPKQPSFDWPVVGDLDKLERATLDGLQQGKLLADDKHVVESHTTKAFGLEGFAHIHVSTTDPY
jgi:Holliday junction resolvase RusA-like endonuclease